MLSKKPILLIALLSSLVLIAGLLQFDDKKASAASDDTTDGTVYLPLLTNEYDSRWARSIFGVQVYTSTDLNSPYHEHMVNSQTTWVRSRVLWELVEPKNVDVASFDWAWADASLAAASKTKGGLKLIVVFETVPGWAQKIKGWPDGPIDPDALDDFADFVSATVERYDGDGFQDAPGRPIIKHWELFNEPDNNDGRWGQYGAEYAAMLQVAYGAIKAADPAAQVLFGGLAYDWFDGPFNRSFLSDVLAAGGGPYFDVMNFHLYPIFAPVTWGSTSTGLMEKTAAIRAELANYGLEKPLVITEAGWYSNADADPPSSDQEQIARLIQFFAQGYAADIDVIVWWMLYDPGNFLNDAGLVTNASQGPVVPKPSYTAYQTAVSLIAYSDFVKELSVSATGSSIMEAYQFRNSQGDLYVAWINPYGTSEVRPLTVPAREVLVMDGQGNGLGTYTDGNGDGLVSVNITDQPVYIQVVR